MDVDMIERKIGADMRVMMHEAEHVLSIELVPATGIDFPLFTPGSISTSVWITGWREAILTSAPDDVDRDVIAMLDVLLSSQALPEPFLPRQ